MAKRDINVVVSARTDAASFQKAEARTRGFFAKMRDVGGRSVLGGKSDTTALERSQRILGQVAAVTAVTVAAKEAANSIGAVMDLAAARSAEIRGDIKGAAEGYRGFLSSMRDGFVTGPLTQLFEEVESLVTGNKKIEDLYASFDEKNAKAAMVAANALKRQAKLDALSRRTTNADVAAFQNAEAIRVQRTGDEGDIQTHAIQRAADAKKKQLHLLQQEIAAMDESAQKTEMLERMDRIRLRVTENMAAAIEQADAKRAEAVQKQIDTMRRSADAEERLFGKEGADREIEAIKLRTEAREREIQKIIEVAETEKQRLSLARLLADVQQQSQAEIAAASAADQDKPEARRVERAGLATAEEGLLMSGLAASAQAGRAIEQSDRRERRKAEEDAAKQRAEQTAVLVQLVQAAQQSGYKPVLN